MVGLERGTVALVPHDPAWREAYEAEVERLESIAGDRFLGYEHVGSTAIEGIPAKPVIDLLALVEDLTTARDLVPELTDHGYEHRPDGDVAGRIFLARGPRSNRTHYLSITERGSEVHRESVAFRDHLRENPSVAEEYAALKRNLAAEYPDDRDAYTAAKGEFVERVLDRALHG
ncbi:hypothetical protein BRD00_14440 [Halobacteriales archaeon QS_8_69_26]|nr:MAG: hypothetical protein BRD00_14440 [Halobacteriales archaeon QS_8_69_26]